MDIKHIQTFVALARIKSFTKTAEELNYAQSTVSSHIKALEDQIGSSLFERLGKKIYLSDAGRNFLIYGNRMLDIYNEAMESLAEKDEPIGVLTVGAPESLSVYRLPELIQLYRNKYPKVRLQVKLDSCNNLYEMIMDNRIDIGFLFDSLGNKEFIHESTLQEEKICLFVNSNHPLTRIPRISAVELSKYPLVVVEESDCSYNHVMLNRLHAQGVIPKEIEKYGSIEMVKHCTLKSQGIGLLPEMTISKNILDGNLIALNEEGPIVLPVSVVYHRSKRVTLAMQKLLDLSAEYFKIS